MGARWAYHDDVVRMAAAFRPALQRRGVPQAIYLDNGSPFVDAWLLRGCAVLGIRLIHSRPGKPEGRGKIERFFRTVRDQFLVEVGDGAAIADLAEMNRLFQAWVETAYHQAVHSETGEAPIARWARAAPGRAGGPGPGRLREAFLWSERRKATKTALVSLHGNSYQVDAWLAGQYVELVFDPFDLGHVEVRLAGSPPGPPSRSPSAGTATPRPAPATTGSAPSRPRPGSTTSPPSATRHDAGLKDQVSYRSLIDGGQREQDRKRRRRTAVSDSPEADPGRSPAPRPRRSAP